MKLRSIDLFAGIGGIRIGVHQAAKKKKFEYQNVFTSEIDKYCIETYKNNFGEDDIYGDISLISDEEIEKIPNHEILLAGFPCQPFSQAGLKGGFDDTRGTLFFDILRILKIKKPKCFLLENVKNLKGHDGGRTLQVILSSLRQMYYVPEPQVLNAKDFGVPQNRQRIFIVGFLKKHVHKEFKFPKPKNKTTLVSDILQKEETIDKKYTISDRLWSGHKRRKRENKLKGKGFGYGLFNPESSYTNTISARYYKDGSEVLISRGDGKNPRKLTPRECANLQGFPKSFKLNKSDNQAYRQFGNSVSVPVIRAIALKMIDFIKKK